MYSHRVIPRTSVFWAIQGTADRTHIHTRVCIYTHAHDASTATYSYFWLLVILFLDEPQIFRHPLEDINRKDKTGKRWNLAQSEKEQLIHPEAEIVLSPSITFIFPELSMLGGIWIIIPSFFRLVFRDFAF